MGTLTTTPCPTVAAVHDRMLVILRPDQIRIWLESGKDLPASQALMQPYAGEHLMRDGASVLALAWAALTAQADFFGKMR